MGADISTAGSSAPPNRPSRLAPIIERSPLPMVEVEGRNHVVCFVNSAFCDLLQKRRENLIGQPFESIVCNGRKCVELLDRVYETGEGKTHTEPDESDAAPAYWLYAMWPALNENEQPERVVIQLTKTTQFRQNAAAMNEALLLGGLRQHELREAAEKSNESLQAEIVERRRIEAALHAAQEQLRANADKLEQTVTQRTSELQASLGELEVFAYSLAHDLRAPVRAIHGFTQLVLEMPREQWNSSTVELLQRVMTAAIRMDSLIQDILDLCNVIRRPITISPVNVDELLHALVHERPELSPPRARIKIESPLPRVLAHEATLSQCLTNLLSNAVKFVEPGAVPNVRIWAEELRTSSTREPGAPDSTPSLDAPPHSLVRIWVGDQGIGIDAEAHDRIFEIFQRLHGATQYEGSGIGLAIVRKAVQRMGGRVGLESQLGKGSRFWLELPKAPAE
jgi:signal transduction histidine kinase